MISHFFKTYIVQMPRCCMIIGNMSGGFFRAIALFSIVSSICITFSHAEETAPDDVTKESSIKEESGSSHADNIRNVLLDAINATKKASFKATTTVYQNGKKQKDIVLYRMLGPGEIVLEKVENVWTDTRTETYISNGVWTYVFIGDIVMQTAPVAHWENIYSGILKNNLTETTYSISEGKYKDIPCYEISIKTPTEAASVEALINKFTKKTNAKEFITTNFPFVKTYLVGKKNSFIYSCTFYNLKGEKTFSANWGEVDFKTPINTKIFEVPQGNISKLDKHSEEFKRISHLFRMPNPDTNETEAKKADVKKENIDTEKKADDCAKELLYEAKEYTEQANFKSKVPIFKNGKVQKTVNLYRKKQDNTILEKVENIWTDAQKESYIINDSGTYVILGNMIMKTETPIRVRNTIYTSINKRDEKGAEYTVADGTYKDIPCNKITVKLPKDKATIDEQIIMHWQITKNAQEYVEQKLPFTKHYLIDKENKFIYSCELYNMQGEKIFSANWGEVDFKTPIDSNIFSVPKGDVEQVDKNSDKIKYISQLFSLPNPDANEAETKKAQKSVATEEAEKARSILFAAMKETGKSSFKATSVVTKGGKPYRTTTSYHMVTPDGTLKERVEYIWPKSKETYIANPPKTLVLVNNTVIKADFRIGSRTFIYKNVKSDISEDATYSMEYTTYKNIPCYKITVKIPTDETYVNDRIKRMRRTTSEHEKTLMDKLPFVKTYVVGQKNLFIYSCTCYNIMGRKTISEEWGDIDFNAQMSNSLFEAPQGVPVVFAQTYKDFEKVREKSLATSR